MTIVTTREIVVGSAVAKPGELVCGWLEGPQLPTGISERLPVMLVQGYEPGPTFWFTANIHGNELTGVPALHDTITAELARHLRGTVVAMPSLNPSGLRVEQRRSYYDATDPNRLFPEYVKADDSDEHHIPTLNELLMANIYQHIEATADFLVDLHCYDGQATPFTIRDRVLYKNEEDQPAASLLQERLDQMARAFGLPIVNEYLAEKYIKQKLHRSTSGIALNKGRIPSFTVELGVMNYVDEKALEAAKTGILNVLKWAGMLPGEPEAVTSVPVPQPGFNTRRQAGPKTPVSGLVRYKVRAGDIVSKGDVVAVITDVFGQALQEITAHHDGWIMTNSRGLIIYQGQSICTMAVRDDDPLLVPFPA